MAPGAKPVPRLCRRGGASTTSEEGKRALLLLEFATAIGSIGEEACASGGEGEGGRGEGSGGKGRGGVGGAEHLQS